MKIGIIFNPRAGLPKRINAMQKHAVSVLHEFGHSVEVRIRKPGEESCDLTHDLLSRGCELIAGAGGDGTINRIAQVLIGTSIPIMHLPLGSGNGFARMTGIALRFNEALLSLAFPVVRTIDTGKVNGKRFLISCGFGFDALVAHEFEQQKYRGILPYVAIGLRRHLTYKPERYVIHDLDHDDVRERDALLVAATISPQYGGGAIVAPGAKPDDGLFDWVEGSPVPIAATAFAAYHLFSGQLEKSPYYHRIQTTHIRLTRLSERREMHRDGEPDFSEKENLIEIDPLSLRTVVGERFANGWCI